jgi:hypothetical protein
MSSCCVSQQYEAYRIITFGRRRSLKSSLWSPFQRDEGSITFRTGLIGRIRKRWEKGVEMALRDDLNGCEESRSYYRQMTWVASHNNVKTVKSFFHRLQCPQPVVRSQGQTQRKPKTILMKREDCLR